MRHQVAYWTARDSAVAVGTLLAFADSLEDGHVTLNGPSGEYWKERIREIVQTYEQSCKK